MGVDDSMMDVDDENLCEEFLDDEYRSLRNQLRIDLFGEGSKTLSEAEISDVENVLAKIEGLEKTTSTIR